MILVTGATGFVGRALIQRLAADTSIGVVAAVRRQPLDFPSSVASVQTGDLLPTTDWNQALQGVQEVIHCAARVHVMNDKSADPLEEFRRVNVLGTANLARQAAAAGVRRFVFLSSIKVNGESTEGGRPFTADDPPAPLDPYGVSKHEAEQVLRQIGSDSGMEIVIIRPPLVYGPGVKANFKSIMRWLNRGLPLPLAAVTANRRSLVAVDTLVDLVMTCLNHSSAANQTFLVSDGEDLSTAELLKRMAAALGRPARLVHVPPALLRIGAAIVNRPGIYQRLCGSLQLDIAKTRSVLGWSPSVSVEEGLRRTAEEFRQ
ncbi:UDP-glucose 4-epimerase family protein [Herbaspirillum robiniae]|uniref:NAD-dependent dehydratase n=1 Tax=Herbaspirillum robiniae TaxID=2014887 RepID=A0A246WLS2_9BURK|nr:SDR family oxidoreductase [Herbaspirillum robiniae]OWY27287.1 NAD-dependent dehydratase [Herbaspirillum robiniae]